MTATAVTGTGPAQRFARLSRIWIVALTVGVGLGLTFLVSKAVLDRDMQTYSDLANRYLNQRISTDMFAAVQAADHPVLRNVVADLDVFTDVQLIKLLDKNGLITWSDFASLIGEHESSNPSLVKALQGTVSFHYEALDDLPAERYRRTHFDALPWMHEVYLPIRDASGAVAGVVEIYRVPRLLRATSWWYLLTVWVMLVSASGFYMVLSHRLFARTARDLAAAQAAVERGRRLAAVGEYVSMIVHDMRNLLASMRFACQRMASDNVTQEDRLMLARSLNKPLALTFSMMNALLEFVSNRQPELDCREHNLKELLDDAEPMLRSMAESAGHHLRMEVPQDLAIFCDGDRLLTAVLNLVKNSTDAMETPGEIAMVAERTERGVEITVQDNGPGIPDHLFPIMFEPLVSENHQLRPGLGLAIVRDVIERHGGQILARNRSEGGAEFVLVFNGVA